MRLVIPSVVATGGGNGGGSSKATTLLSITTAPSAPFEKGSKYYNSTTKKIYTAKEDNTWTNAKETDPSFGAYYVYDNETYTWDGNSLEIFELEDYQEKLVSGSNIKTINGDSILGSGNLEIDTFPSQTGNTGKSLVTDGTNVSWQNVEQIKEQNANELIKYWYGTQNEYDALENYDNNTVYVITDNSSILSTLLATQQEFDSNAQNKAATPYQVNNILTTDLATKQDILTAGAGISISGNVISATDTLPSQTNNQGKVLTTDGTNTSWQYAAQFVSGNTQNNVEIGSGLSELDWNNLQVGDRLDNKATYIGTFNAEDPNSNAQAYAVFVLDAQYRGNAGSVQESNSLLPHYWGSGEALASKLSATYNTDTILANYTAANFTDARNAATVVVNGVTYYSQLPNLYELNTIYTNRALIDSLDPTVSAYPTYSLVNWQTDGYRSSTCDGYNGFWCINSAGAYTNLNTVGGYGWMAVFEIPLPIPEIRYTNVNRLKVNGVIYQIQDKSQFEVSVDSTTPTLNLVDNTFYNCTNALTSLTITSIPVVNASGIEIHFTTDVGFTGVTFPQGTLYTGTIPTWEAGKTYLINISRNVVVAAEIKTME